MGLGRLAQRHSSKMRSDVGVAVPIIGAAEERWQTVIVSIGSEAAKDG